jgi:hypothetical protein
VRDLLDYDVGVATTDTLDSGECEHDLLLSLDIGVKQTENVLKGVFVRDNESHIVGWLVGGGE